MFVYLSPHCICISFFWSLLFLEIHLALTIVYWIGRRRLVVVDFLLSERKFLKTTTTTTTTTTTFICRETNFQGPRFLVCKVANLQLSEKKRKFTNAPGGARVMGMLGISHFRVSKTVSFKTLPRAKHFLWKRVLFAWNKKSFSHQKLRT